MLDICVEKSIIGTIELVQALHHKYEKETAHLSLYENPDSWDAYRYEHAKRIKTKAKRFNIPFDINPDLLVYPDVCPVLGIPITRKLTRDNFPTFDRVDSNKGYTNDNVVIISHKANRMKQDNSIETLEKLLQYMKGHTNVC